MKKWVKRYSLWLFIILLIVGSFNYTIDPLWTFSHKNFLQNHQEGFDERQQKLNLMYFNEFNYDGVILGSSRVTLHNVNTFKNKKIFNLAVDGMRPYEFESFIEYAKERNKKDFKYIILGLDFITIDDNLENYNIKDRIHLTESMFYRYKMLFSYDATVKSIRNIKNTKMDKYKNRFKTYNNNYIASTYVDSEKVVNEKVKIYLRSNQNKIIEYTRDDYIKVLQAIKKHNPHSQIIVFSTPLPAPLIKAVLSHKKNQETYNQWVQDILNIFGSHYTFFDINDITKDYVHTFTDSGHYYPFVGNCINQKIFNFECQISVNSNNFGFLITKENSIDFIKQQIMRIKELK